MIVDSSALVAMLRDEPLAPLCEQAINRAPIRRLSAANYLEAAIVVDSNRDPVLSRRFDDLLRISAIDVVAVTEEQAYIARAAYRDFGRGCGHPARLNFGDCFAYALAKVTGDTLLFTGEDFRQTDVAPAMV
jgi:ribonuclease VapC